MKIEAYKSCGACKRVCGASKPIPVCVGETGIYDAHYYESEHNGYLAGFADPNTAKAKGGVAMRFVMGTWLEAKS